MLGKKIDVHIVSYIPSAGLYRGFFLWGTHRRSVYLLCHDKPSDTVHSTIIAIAHNHPSGSLRPSKNDDQLTQAVKQACDIMRIHFLDHIIITDGSYYSYHEQGKC